MKRDKVLETILVLTLAGIVLFWIFHSRYFLIGGFVIGVSGLMSNFLAEKIHWFWMKLAHVLGQVTSKILLTIIYIVVVLPLAFFSRLAGKSSIQLKSKSTSYFKERNFTYTKESLEKMW